MIKDNLTGIASTIFMLNGVCLLLFSIFSYGSDYETVIGLIGVWGFITAPVISLLKILLLIAVTISILVTPREKALILISICSAIYYFIVVQVDFSSHYKVFIIITAIYAIFCIVGPFLPLGPNKSLNQIGEKNTPPG